MYRATAVFAVVAVSLTASTFGQAPLSSGFTYQGSLDSGGAPANGSYDLQFKLFNSLSVQVGSTTCADNVSVVDGLFTVQLDFGVDVFNGEARSLEVGVRSDNVSGNCAVGVYTTLAARQPLTAAPYALQTRGIFTNSALNVGIGTTAPAAKLDVNTAAGTGIIGRSAAGSNSVYGIDNATVAYPFSDAAGVRGDGTGSGQVGVMGVSNNYVGVEGYTSTGIASVFGRHDGDNGVAFYGVATGASSTALFASGTTAAQLLGAVNITDPGTLGIQFSGHGEVGADTGIGHPADGVLTFIGNNTERARIDANGTLFVNSTSTPASGVKFHSENGTSASWNPDSGAAVSAETTSTAALDGITDTGFGIVAACQSNNIGTAGLFVGRVNVVGTLSKSGGSFKIDHPLDPANKYLFHSFVESPDMKNIYDGTVTTDADGLATVELPDWFQALNKDFRYQLTVIGQFAQAIVAEEVNDNRFVIRTDKPNVRVSWQVTGIRQDAFANAYRIPVEQEKTADERGKYLFPELFGAAPDMRIGPLVRRTAEQLQALRARQEADRAAATAAPTEAPAIDSGSTALPQK